MDSFSIVEPLERPHALTAAEYKEIVLNMDNILGVLERRVGALNFTELRTKSIVKVLREEMAERLRSSPPFDGNTPRG